MNTEQIEAQRVITPAMRKAMREWYCADEGDPEADAALFDAFYGSAATATASEGRIAELEAALRAICDMQAENYGNGLDTHIDLISLAEAGRAALAGSATPIPSTEPVEPVAWVHPDELAKLADPRIAGRGVMLHKEASGNLVALFTASQSAPQDTLKNADSERLDWLEQSSQTFCGNYTGSGFRTIGSSIWHGTLREAIDGSRTAAIESKGGA